MRTTSSTTDDDDAATTARQRLARWTGQDRPTAPRGAVLAWYDDPADREAWHARHQSERAALAEFYRMQIGLAIGFLAERATLPDAVERASVILRAAPDAPDAERWYGLAAVHPACAGMPAECDQCHTAWELTPESTLYRQRPTSEGDPLAGLCFSCAIGATALDMTPAGPPAITAGPPAIAVAEPVTSDSEPPSPPTAAEILDGHAANGSPFTTRSRSCPECGSGEPSEAGACRNDWHPEPASPGPAEAAPPEAPATRPATASAARKRAATARTARRPAGAKATDTAEPGQ